MRKAEVTAGVVIGLCVAAFITLASLWIPLVLAAWFADVLQPAIDRLQRVFRGRHRGAAAVVVLLALAVILPLTGVVIGVIAGLHGFVEQLRAAVAGQGSIAQTLLGGTPGHTPGLRDWVTLLTRYGANAWDALLAVVQTSTAIAIGVLVFCLGLYTMAAKGPRARMWLARHAPIRRDAFDRLLGAFFETGRGLLIGNGVTAFAQGATATLVFAAVGIPRAFLLGPLTMIAALVPVFGTGLVWVPLALGLFATHEYTRAVAVTILGAGILSTMDNFLRPVLTRYGKLEMPTYLVLISMLGGITAFGPAGLLLGPLVVRMATEGLSLAREERLFH